MTTVAYRDGVMAADSSALDGDLNVTPTRKLWRVGGGLVGMAGNIIAMEAFVRWLADGADQEDFPKGFYDAMVVDPRGRISLYEGGGPDPIRVTAKYAAIGSGATAALGALYAGADARTAVRAAIQLNTQSKAPVRFLRIGGGK